MVDLENEDAFPAANKHAGKITRLADALSTMQTEEQATVKIAALQSLYQLLFDAFIAGVAFGRNNPLKG